MINQRKILPILKHWGIALLVGMFLFASLVRFYNFSDRITFGPEQAISLLVSADYVNEKFSLLGLPSTQRTTSLGHIIFYPPIFNYSLIPLLIFFNYDETLITVYFALLNLITGVFIYLFTKRILDKTTALFASILFLFNDLMINHSLFIWSVNYLPLLNLIILYLLASQYLKKPGKLDPFLIGLLVSFSLGVEYIYIFTAIPIFLLTVYFSRNHLLSLVLFSLGAILGILPTIIFDLSHEFYHFKTLWQYLIDTLVNPGQSKITYYHFLQFWPLLAILGGVILSKVYKLSKASVFILLTTYIILNLFSPNISFTSPVGMYPNLNISKIEKTAKLISEDRPWNFNVVMTFDFDSRAHPLRYLLKHKYGLKPEGVENYPKSQNLYVLTTKDYPIFETDLWEISSFSATQTQVLGDIDEFRIFKLTK